MGRAGVKIDAVTGGKNMGLVGVPNLQFAVENVKEFVAGMHVRANLDVLLEGDKFREIRIQLAVGNHVPEALEVIGRIVDSGLGQTNALFFAMDAEERVRLRLKEVRQDFAKNHGHPSQVAQGRDNTAGLQLREEAGG